MMPVLIMARDSPLGMNLSGGLLVGDFLGALHGGPAVKLAAVGNTETGSINIAADITGALDINRFGCPDIADNPSTYDHLPHSGVSGQHPFFTDNKAVGTYIAFHAAINPYSPLGADFSANRRFRANNYFKIRLFAK
jgi:hypothetical protein